MINSQFKLRVERQIQSIHGKLRTRLIEDENFYSVLKKIQSCYIALDAGTEWKCTIGLMDPLYEEHNQLYNGVTQCNVDILLRHKTDASLFVDVITKVTDAMGQRHVADYPHALVSNMETHVEYELIKAALDKIEAAIGGLDFTTATVIFKKRDPSAP